MQGKEDPFAKAAFVIDKISGGTYLLSKVSRRSWVWRPVGVKMGLRRFGFGAFTFSGMSSSVSFKSSSVIWVFVQDSLRPGKPAHDGSEKLRIGMSPMGSRTQFF